MAPKKGLVGGLEAKKSVLSAVLLADSFTQQFRPMTIERPKVLLPLVNVPMIDYTLEWLVAGGIKEVIIFCCAHASQIQRHIDTSKWGSQKSVNIQVITERSCRSAGDALRALDQKGIMEDDFVLVSGDVVANLNIAAVLEEHRLRRAKDQNAIMTMVMKPMQSAAQRWRLGLGEALTALDPSTHRLLRYDPLDGSFRKRRAAMEAQLWGERDVVSLRTDLCDCHVAICSLEVLVAFSDNFDYQNIQRDFVSGVLSEEELGNKIYVHEAVHDYVVRVHNLRSYDAVSSDILQRWAFPFTPDTNLLPLHGPWGPSTFCYTRHNIYKEQSVCISRSAQVGHDTAIGAGTHIEDHAQVVSSVIGRNCRVGKNACIRGSTLHGNVTVEDGAVVTEAVLCEGCTVMTDAVIAPGAIVSFKVVVGRGQTIPAHTRVSLCQQLTITGSDDELEYAKPEDLEDGESQDMLVDSNADQVEKPLAAVVAAAEALAGRHRPRKGPQEDFSSDEEGSVISTADIPDAVLGDPEASFKREVTETFLRCVKHGFDQDYAVVELNGLKIAEDRTFADCSRHMFTAILGLCLPAPPRTKAEYLELYPQAAVDFHSAAGRTQLLQRLAGQLQRWVPLLQRFLRSEDDQVEVLLTLEEFSGEGGSSGEAFAAVFAQVLKLLYDTDLVEEGAMLAWAAEKEHAEAHERVYVDKASEFLQWLREAEEEEEDDDDEEADAQGTDNFVRFRFHPSARDEKKPHVPDDICLNVVVLGASGDLAKKKTFPALYTLFYRKHLPESFAVIGYARSKLSNEDLREKIRPMLKGGTDLDRDNFISAVTYVSGSYDDAAGYQGLHKALKERESSHAEVPIGRLFYLALPPSVYPQVCRGIKHHCEEMDQNPGCWQRIVIEKPFGKDFASSEKLADELNDLFPEEQLYRIDHYLGKELMQNMLVLRFANAFLGPMWDCQSVSNVQICFKEDIGTEGRGGYFDEFGIIRDVMQNHLMQVLALLAMEKPISMSADDIRDEKTKLLRCVKAVKAEDCVLGQYTANEKMPGYKDDEGVPKDSKTPTFAVVVLKIQNDRWHKTPFILKAGKALNERKAEIRIQFRPPAQLLHGDKMEGSRNELVVRIQPNEAIYLKLVAKQPGLGMKTLVSELDLTYKDRYPRCYIPEAYERLILDAIRGDQQHFVRRDELRAAWAIFTPLLHAIDDKRVKVHDYKPGTRGPPEADKKIAEAGYIKNKTYEWCGNTVIVLEKMREVLLRDFAKMIGAHAKLQAQTFAS
ncbi:hypothetical protein WJX73_003563 [Symbiochloris irregularis]|uniref:Glucose-6-phosphate 1-dehydrogenase n=1 Tax=Symbiochloris irregularis TaxID=706552 RepID=A0AAW1NU81_9CHLO